MAVCSDGLPYTEPHRTFKILFHFMLHSTKSHKADNLENRNITLQPHCTSAITSCNPMKCISILIEKYCFPVSN